MARTVAATRADHAEAQAVPTLLAVAMTTTHTCSRRSETMRYRAKTGAGMTFMTGAGSDLHGDTVLLTVREAMRLLRIQSPRTMRAWERAGHGPQPLSVGRPDAKRRTLRYRLEDVRDFLRADGE